LILIKVLLFVQRYTLAVSATQLVKLGEYLLEIRRYILAKRPSIKQEKAAIRG